jgi:5-methylcytosine-specific restriction endonuclease McrA
VAITKTYVGLNPDGTPHFHYQSDGHVVVTGNKVFGMVTLPDGTEYDVSDHVIEVASPEHAEEVAAQIHSIHQGLGAVRPDGVTPLEG